MREFSWHQVLRAKLPGIDAPYHSTHLTDEEREAFQLALRDGFGDVQDDGAWSAPLPDNINAGILEHRFFIARSRGESDDIEEDEQSHSFWKESDGDSPPGPFEHFPLHFDLQSIRIYFENQRARYVHNHKRNERVEADALSSPILDPDNTYDFNLPEWFFGGDEVERISFDESIWQLAKFSLYTKPWYEFHALSLLELADTSREDRSRLGPNGGHLQQVFHHLTLEWIGQLGRLIEQYNWRFRFEDAARSGLASRRGASAGGLARSKALSRQHNAWDSAAKAIWLRRPELSKSAVAELVRKQLRLGVTGKHICRFIDR